MHVLMMEQGPVGIFPRSWLDHPSTKISLTVTHRRKSEVRKHRLDIIIAIVNGNSVEGMEYRNVNKSVSIIIEHFSEGMLEFFKVAKRNVNVFYL